MTAPFWRGRTRGRPGRFWLSAMLAALLGGVVSARDLPQILKEGTLRVGMLGEYPGLNEVIGGKRTGFEVDFVTYFAQALGLKVIWVSSSLTTFSKDLKANSFDFLLPEGMQLTGKNVDGLTMTDAYYCSGAVILSRGVAVKNSAGLLGRRIAVQPGKQYFDYLKRLALDKNSNVAQDASAAILALIYKTSDVAIVDKLEALAAFSIYPKADLKMSYPIWETRFSAVMLPQDTKLKQAFSKSLSEAVASGNYDKMTQIYFPQSIRCSGY